MERVEPNRDAEPLELEGATAAPGNTIVRRSSRRPMYEIVDTQQGGGKGWPDGVVVQSATEPDGLSFLTAQVIEGMLSTGEIVL